MYWPAESYAPVLASMRTCIAGQTAIPGGADSVADPIRVAFWRGGERLLPGIDQHDGPAHRVGHQRGGDERPGVLLAAERAADGRDDDPDLLPREGEAGRDVVLLVVRLVHAADDGQPAVLVVVAQQRFALERAVLEEGRAVLCLDHHVRLRESGFQVAVPDLVGGEHVAAARDMRGLRQQRGFDVEGVRQDFVIDRDCGCRGPGRLRRFCDDEGDRRARHANGGAHRREHRLFLAVVAQAVLAGYVGGGEDGDDAGNGPGGAASTDMTRAWWWGERTTLPYSIPGSRMSST